MRPGVYKHVNNTDVAMKVLKSLWIPEKNAYRVRNLWLNIVNPNNVFLLDPQPETNWITVEQVKNWKVYDVAV